MRRFHRGALQRQAPKRPHKPSSQALGARMLERQHWRKAASLERQTITYAISTNATTPLTISTYEINGQRSGLVPTSVPDR